MDHRVEAFGRMMSGLNSRRKALLLECGYEPIDPAIACKLRKRAHAMGMQAAALLDAGEITSGEYDVNFRKVNAIIFHLLRREELFTLL